MKVRLVAVAGSSALIAHSRPSIGRGFVDGIGCNRLATMFMEKLDVNLFHVLSERLVTREPFEVLADICSCLPVSLYANSVQD